MLIILIAIKPTILLHFSSKLFIKLMRLLTIIILKIIINHLNSLNNVYPFDVYNLNNDNWKFEIETNDCTK